MKIKQLIKRYFPTEEKYWLTDQIIRAVNSIVLNIAEEADRETNKDYALFLNRSHTSLNEVVACLDIALKESYISPKIHENYLKSADELANQITALEENCLLVRQNES